MKLPTAFPDIKDQNLKGLPCSSVLLIAVALFTGYAYLNAINLDRNGNVLLALILGICLTRLLFLRDFSLNKDVIFFVCSFLIISWTSVLFPPSSYASFAWLKKASFLLLAGLGIVSTVFRLSKLEKAVLRTGIPLLCFLLAFLVILDAYGVVSKELFLWLTPLRVVNHLWNDKYFAFWLLFLMWGSVALLWRRDRRSTIISLLLICFSFWALFLTTSESAQLAAVAGLLIFIMVHVPVGFGRYWLYLAVFSLMLLIPVAWIFLTPLYPESADSLFYKFLKNTQAVDVRLRLYDFCAHTVRKELIHGHGFGSTLLIPITPDVFPDWKNTLPGGHPHNLIFLFFLEHGLIGFLWLTTAFICFFDRVYSATRKRLEEPAIWALILSAHIVFSLSFAIWQSDVVLLYVMFFVLLRIILPENDYGREKSRNSAFLRSSLLILTLLGVSSYVSDYYLNL